MPDVTGSSRPDRAGTGEALVVVSALAFSTAGLFTRGTAVDLVALLFWRNLFGAAALLPLAALGTPGAPSRWIAGLRAWDWAMVAASSLATFCFLAALRLTSVADVAIIYAAAPLVAALIAWLWLGERPQRRTLAASLLALAGTGVTIAGSVGGGTPGGDGLAGLMTVAMAVMTVLARRHGSPPALVLGGLSAVAPALLVLPLVLWTPACFALQGGDAAGIAGFGVVTMAVALPCYLGGAARLPAARAMLLSALEMPFAPLWVWLAFGDAPAGTALVGGSLVAAAIAWDVIGPRVR